MLCRLWAEVLGVASIEADQHFFLAGGDSIQLGLLLVKVEQEFAVRLPLSRLGEYTTPARMLQCLLQTPTLCSQPTEAYGTAITAFPASWTQQGLWFSELQAGNCGLYNRALLLTLEGELSLPVLRAAVNAVRQRFPLLRASLQPDLQGRSLRVQVNPHENLALPVEPCVDPLLTARREVSTPFEMSLSLWRFRVLQAPAAACCLLVCAHHTACDGWSGAVLLQALAEAYAALLVDPAWQVHATDAAFAQHCLQQLQHATSPRQVINLHWWRGYLAGADRVCSAWLSGRLSQWPYQIDRVQRQLESGAWARLQHDAAKAGLTLFAVLAATLGQVLCEFMQAQECVVAFPHANRCSVPEQDSIGCYMQVLPLRLRANAAIAQVHADLLAVQHHAEPWPLLVQSLRPACLPDGSAWTSVMLALHNFPRARPQFPSLQVSAVSIEPELGQQFLAFEVFPDKEGARLVLSHARELINNAEAESLLLRWQAGLASLADTL